MFVRLTYQIGQLFLLEMDSGPTVIDHMEVGRRIERSMEILKTNAKLSPILVADRSICILDRCENGNFHLIIDGVLE